MTLLSKLAVLAAISCHCGLGVAVPAPRPMHKRKLKNIVHSDDPTISVGRHSTRSGHHPHATLPAPHIETRDFLTNFGGLNVGLDHASTSASPLHYYTSGSRNLSTPDRLPLREGGNIDNSSQHTQQGVRNKFKDRIDAKYDYYAQHASRHNVTQDCSPIALHEAHLSSPLSYAVHQQHHHPPHIGPFLDMTGKPQWYEGQDEGKHFLPYDFPGQSPSHRLPFGEDMQTTKDDTLGGRHAVQLATTSSTTLHTSEQQSSDRSAVNLFPPDQIRSDGEEYTLIVSPRFESSDDTDKAYLLLSLDQKSVIIDRIHQVRPYTVRYLRLRLAENLTPPLAHALLSSDQARLDEAIETLFPDEGGKKDTAYNAWMAGLTHNDRKQVIKKLSFATLQSADKLRDFFLYRNVSKDVAQLLLRASTDAEIKALALEYQLLIPENKKARDKQFWQIGTSYVQRKAIRQRMMRCGFGTQACYDLLAKFLVPVGYGLTMLRANEAQFRIIMEWLQGRIEGPPPFA
ncbi:hypothetical protein CBS101457_000063 [Exobasidium rhododendri]|nr:hypothetical protein CBS101457_000063 [Exobasidium rhododendri]